MSYINGFKIFTERIPYKYWYIESSNDPKDNLFYLYCTGNITKDQNQSVRKLKPKQIEKFIHNKCINFYKHINYWYAIRKSNSLNDLIDNLIFNVADVLLLNNDGSGDAEYTEMIERILAITERSLLGAREQKDKIINHLKNNLSYSFSEYNYDSADVRNTVLTILKNYKNNVL